MVRDNKLNQIVKRYRENKMAHAYLIETNNQEECLKDLINVIKEISCMNEYKEDCKECNLCNLISLNNLPTLKIIEPDGNTIKKGQIQELKDNFSSKPIYSKHNIYIIKNAEKLNASSANTMLKFLEEPDGQVLGFFITNNKENILLTIQSRCQIIRVNYNSDTTNEYFGVPDSELNEILPLIKKYVEDIETNNKLAILNNKKIMLAKVLELVKLEVVFKILLDIYKEALYYKRGISDSFTKYSEFSLVLDNDIKILQKKVNLLIEYVNNSNYNLNTELVLDRFILEMGGINE